MSHPCTRTAALIVLISVIVACDQRSQVQRDTALDWPIELDQPIRQLEEILAVTEQQQQMNLTAANIGFLYDAKLHLHWQRYTASLPEAERTTAIESQRQWLDERREKTAEAGREYEGGSLSSFVASQAFIAATKKRIAELQARLSSDN